jgi:dTDP-glucose 4,6-dehydratase
VVNKQYADRPGAPATGSHSPSPALRAGRQSPSHPLAQDLDHVLAHTGGLWDELRGRRVFITGGTGFFGCWLLESFTWANDRLGLGARAVVLTRDPAAFARKAPHLAGHPAVRLHRGDVRSFAFPLGPFHAVVHAATESSTTLNANDPLTMLDTVVQGTRRTLEFARACAARHFLLTSSGAVYGRQPPELSHVPEDYVGAPDPADPRSAYGEGKRVAEHLCALYHQRHGVAAKVARCFAFVGPYLPLGAHFAVGNFLRDGLAGGPIRVQGDGTPYRSYLYAADLAAWLWTILFRGEPCRPYNVGSADAVSIADLARQVAGHFGAEVHVARAAVADRLPERYVPAVERAARELGLRPGVCLADAIARSAHWHRQAPGKQRVPARLPAGTLPKPVI